MISKWPNSSLKSMNLGDVSVKKFGNDGDYLIKVEQKNTNDNEHY